jgi:hypothetical protein
MRSFKFSNDPQLEEKVSDVIGLYLHPPEQALVLCVDEKSQIQAVDRSQPLLPMRPHQVERRTHDYVRLASRHGAEAEPGSKPRAVSHVARGTSLAARLEPSHLPPVPACLDDHQDRVPLRAGTRSARRALRCGLYQL